MWCTSYTQRTLEFYESLSVRRYIGCGPEETGRLSYPLDLAVHRTFLFVTDWVGDRLVVFRTGSEGEEHQYLCNFQLKRPVGCAVSKRGIVFVTCYRPDVIRELQFDDRREELRPLRTLTANGCLAYPKGLTLDIQERYLYVACWDAVKKISVYEDTVSNIVTKPEHVKESLALSVASMNNILVISYDFPSALVIHLQDDLPGWVLTLNHLLTPCGICRHGNNFLICDVRSKCVHVINAKGQPIGRLEFTDAVPRHVIADETTIYVTDATRRQTFVLGPPSPDTGLFLPLAHTSWAVSAC